MFTSRRSGNLFYDGKYFFFVVNRLVDNRSYLTVVRLWFPEGDQYYFTVLSHLMINIIYIILCVYNNIVTFVFTILRPIRIEWLDLTNYTGGIYTYRYPNYLCGYFVVTNLFALLQIREGRRGRYLIII